MAHCDLPRASASLAILLGVLSSCAPATQYQNAAHPNYGDAEYKTDLAQCRHDNSTTKTTQGYDIQTTVVVDEPKAASCMTARGWQPMSK
jgi:hypothetical protein